MRATQTSRRTTSTTTRRSLKRSTVLSLAALATAALSLVLVGNDTASAAGSFNPQGTLALANPAAGANSDINGTFDLLAPDYNFRVVVSFTPPEFVVAKDEDVPNGATGVELASQATLGLLNGPCAPSGVKPEFTMMDATTDHTGPTVTFEDDTGDPGTLGEIFEDADGNGLPEGVDKYPDFLTRIFPGIKPRARLYGQTSVVGVDVSLNFVIFEPGTTLGVNNPVQLDPALGYPSVTVLQNAGDPDAQPTEGSPITDFCTPLLTETTTLGQTGDNANTGANEGGVAYRGNPSADGTFNFITFAAGSPDADGDGYENGFDSCPYQANLDGDPRGPTESDFDGIDSACDPDPNSPCGSVPGDDNFASDCDADTFLNRGDNCVFENNPLLPDKDSDQIGDACDNNPDTVDGEVITKCIIFPVNVGAGGTAPSEPNVCSTSAVGIDLDGNGVFDSLEGPVEAADADGDGVPDADDRCANTPAGATVDQFGCTPQQAVLDDDNDGVLNVNDKCPGTAAGATVDADGCSAEQLASAGAGTGSGSGTGGPSTGVGSLAPAVASIPAWAAIASGLGGAGLLGSLGAFASRLWRRRR